MSLTGLISFGLLALLGLVALPQIPRLWRHETTFYDRVPSWWAGGERGWSAWVRTLPVGACLAYLAILMGLYLAVISPALKLSRQVDLIAIWVFLVVFFTIFAVMCSVFLFNWPKFLVPKHLREDKQADPPRP